MSREMTAFNYPREGFSRVERRGETRKIKGHGDNATVPSLSFSLFFFFLLPSLYRCQPARNAPWHPRHEYLNS